MKTEKLSQQYVENNGMGFGRFFRLSNGEIVLHNTADPDNNPESRHVEIAPHVSTDPSRKIIDAGQYALNMPVGFHGIKFHGDALSLGMSRNIIGQEREVTRKIAEGMLAGIPGFVVAAE